MFTHYFFIFLLLTTAPVFSAVQEPIIEKPAIQEAESEKTFFGLKASDFFVTHSFFNEESSAQIAFLMNIHNHDDKYLIKQRTTKTYPDGKLLRIFTSVPREKILANMAEEFSAMTEKKHKVIANKVEIVPAHYPFPGKYNLEKPASLIAFVPGIAVCDLPEGYHKPNLKQFDSDYPHSRAPEKLGLQRRMINDMARHPNLPPLVAFDTFTAYKDRRPANLMYEEKTNRYYAIDMENGFEHNLAKHALRLVIQMIKEKQEEKKQEDEKESASLSLQEIDALKIYQSTLKKLIPMYPPEIIFSKIAQARIEAGIEDHEESSEKEKELQQTIQDNYNSCIQTVASLDALLKMYATVPAEILSQKPNR